MAYMRGDYYIYPTGGGVQIHGLGDDCVFLPNEKADAFALMHVAKMIADGRIEERARLVADRYRGNFSADALNSLLGLQTTMDQIREEFGDPDGG